MGSVSIIPKRLLNIYDGDAGTAKLHVLIAIMRYIGNSGQILANELAKALSVSGYQQRRPLSLCHRPHGVHTGNTNGQDSVHDLLIVFPISLWEKLPLWGTWSVFIGVCAVSALFMFVMMRKLEDATK